MFLFFHLHSAQSMSHAYLLILIVLCLLPVPLTPPHQYSLENREFITKLISQQLGPSRGVGSLVHYSGNIVFISVALEIVSAPTSPL